jgi:hypothetical protein
MDYWFEIITENGTVGYVFGYRLDVVDAQGVSTEKQEQSDDEFLSAILNYQWRPDYYAWMIADGNYDLSRFRQRVPFPARRGSEDLHPGDRRIQPGVRL